MLVIALPAIVVDSLDVQDIASWFQPREPHAVEYRVARQPAFIASLEHIHELRMVATIVIADGHGDGKVVHEVRQRQLLCLIEVGVKHRLSCHLLTCANNLVCEDEFRQQHARLSVTVLCLAYINPIEAIGAAHVDPPCTCRADGTLIVLRSLQTIGHAVVIHIYVIALVGTVVLRHEAAHASRSGDPDVVRPVFCESTYHVVGQALFGAKGLQGIALGVIEVESVARADPYQPSAVDEHLRDIEIREVPVAKACASEELDLIR